MDTAQYTNTPNSSEWSVAHLCAHVSEDYYEYIWTELLLKWLNKCIHPQNPVKILKKKCLLEVVKKYKGDVCEMEPDYVVTIDDIDPLIKYNYPLLKLGNITNDVKKMYIMTSILLYHCCVSSVDGVVDSDICANLDKTEQEMILKYCEKLTDMASTCTNVEIAIKYACEEVKLKNSTHMSEIQVMRSASDEFPPLISDETAQTEGDTTDRTDRTDRTESYLASSSAAKKKNIRFNSSINYSPSPTIKESSVITDDGSGECVVPYASKLVMRKKFDKAFSSADTQVDLGDGRRDKCNDFIVQSTVSDIPQKRALPSQYIYRDTPKKKSLVCLWVLLIILGIVMLGVIIVAVVLFVPWRVWRTTSAPVELKMEDLQTKQLYRRMSAEPKFYMKESFLCRNNLCYRAFGYIVDKVYASLSRCILKCMGPQLWPKPIGFTHFNDKIIAIGTKKLEYNFLSLPSEAVHAYVTQAMKLFIGDLLKLEGIDVEPKKSNDDELFIRKTNIQLYIETDPDPRLRLDTDESYSLKLEVINNIVTIKIVSPSFCGVRHGLETLSQLILLDQRTGYLLTLSNIVIKDAPSYRYRGLMLDTGRNYIPIPDIMRTIDAMATCKLNTFHWRISDVTSFPLLIPMLPQLFEYGGYDRTMVYTKEDVRSVVKRAGIRGIRVLIEVAAPGPVGRAWSWTSEATCPTRSTNLTCDNVLCLRLSTRETVMDVLQLIYSEILEMTQVTDVFHLSDGIFSVADCYYLIEEREGFLEKALYRLKIANKGYLPKLPIIWYTEHLSKESEAADWNRLGVQVTTWQPDPTEPYLNRYKVIQSTLWDLSCEIRRHRCTRYRTWQSMYSWVLWKEVEALSMEGGESLLWTDMVDSGNIDVHLWPRAAAVAERLWSDVAINASVNPSVYLRLDCQRWRMMLKSITVAPIWPMYCSHSPEKCLRMIKKKDSSI